jgi:hypothetical protein
VEGTVHFSGEVGVAHGRGKTKRGEERRRVLIGRGGRIVMPLRFNGPIARVWRKALGSFHGKVGRHGNRVSNILNRLESSGNFYLDFVWYVRKIILGYGTSIVCLWVMVDER